MKQLSKKEAQDKLNLIRAKDPVRRFLDELASPTQREILSAQDDYVLVTSANQGGKTTVAIVDCAAVLRGIHPFQPWFGPVDVAVVVPSRAQAASIWGKRLLECSEIQKSVVLPNGEKFDLSQVPLIPKHEIAKIDWAYSPQGKYPGKLKLKNGSEMVVILSGDPNSWKRLQGVKKHKVYRDEAVGSEDLGNEINPRLLVAQTAARRGDIPWGGRVMWVATATLINDEFEKYKENCEKAVPGYKMFWINPNENPAVSMEVRERMRATMSDDAAAIRLDGSSGAIDSVLIFNHLFSKKRHVLPEVYEPKEEDNLWIAWDPGFKHPFGLVGACISPQNPLQIKVVKCWSEKRTTLDHQANIIAEWLDGRVLEGLVYDPAASKSDYQKGKSIFSQLLDLLNQMGVHITRGFLQGRNRYEDTIPLVQRYLSPDPTNYKVDPLIVINPDSPELQTGCGELVGQIMRYRFKEGQAGTLAGAAVHRIGDDLIDPMRYLISRMPAWAKREPNVRKYQTFAASAYPLTPERIMGELDESADMDEERRMHIQRLKESRARMQVETEGLMSIPSVTMAW